MNRAHRLLLAGQSIWYDNISRDLLSNGELSRLISSCGVRGLTSNPTIFEKAVGSSSIYDSAIRELKNQGLDIDQIIEKVMIDDIAQAADLLLPVYQESAGIDGFVSIEVSPLLASDSEKTIAEARRLHARLARPNIMIKVPGTPEGLVAIAQLLEDGISVNVTLLFSVENYVQVAETYVAALEKRFARGLSIVDVRSVASFFVSRVDAILDQELERIASSDSASDSDKPSVLAKRILGKCAIYNSRCAYQEFRRVFGSERYAFLALHGAKVQRPLWASTSTKNPAYRDVIYVEELVGTDTVNTMPHATLEALLDHADIREDSLGESLDEAQGLAKNLHSLGLDLAEVLNSLQRDGVAKFVDSFLLLKKTISYKIKEL